MYQSNIPLSLRTTGENKKRVLEHIKSHSSYRCGILKRHVSLEKFYEANHCRKDAFIRFQSFFTAIDILKKSKEYSVLTKNGFRCYEITGKAKYGEVIILHLREEEEQKDKRLYLISCFYKK